MNSIQNYIYSIESILYVIKINILKLKNKQDNFFYNWILLNVLIKGQLKIFIAHIFLDCERL